MNSHPSPRDANTRQFIRSLQQQEAQRRKAQLADKGTDTLLDGYSMEQFKKVCESLWEESDVSPECHFRTLVDFLLSHYMLERGCNRRGAEISDVHTFEFPNEGPTRCTPLIFTSREGKENKYGRLQTIGALRHRKPLLCVLSALAFYFLFRWDLTNEEFPDFSQRKAWYDIQLLASSTHGRCRGRGSTTKPLSYSSQLDWINKALEYAGIDSKKKTHIGRSSAAKLAELLGVPEAQIRRQGWWEQDVMVGCYLNSLPREFMRVMAGHPPNMGSFEIPRASLTPPDELLSMIWPDLDQWKDRFGPGHGQHDDLAAQGFTSLLFSLREVVLQDSVTLRKRFPRSPVWAHPVFQHPAYAEFTARMEGTVEVGVDDERPSKLTLLMQAMPELAEGLRGLRGDVQELQGLRGDVRELKLTISTVVEQVQGQSIRNTHIQHLLSSSSLTLPIHGPLPPSSIPPPIPPPSSAPVGAGHTPSLAASRTAAAFDLPVPPRLQQQQPQDPQDPQDPQAPQDPQEPPRYMMSRSVKSVERLWQEWTVGLNGQPSVRALDSKWGNKWRAGRQRELQWYSLRLEVIREIQRRAKAQRSSEEQAMVSLHLQQQQMGCSLDRLCKQLRAGRHLREQQQQGAGGGNGGVM